MRPAQISLAGRDAGGAPAVQHALAKIGTIVPARDAAGDDVKDRIFQRGAYAGA